MIVDYRYVYIAYDEDAHKELRRIAKNKKRYAAFDYCSTIKGLAVFTNAKMPQPKRSKLFTFHVKNVL